MGVQLLRKDPTRMMLPVLCSEGNEDEIWLFLQEFKRIEAPSGKPFSKAERIRLILRALALTPKWQAPVAMTPHPSESLSGLLTQGRALFAQVKCTEALPFFEEVTQQVPDHIEG